jgi:hypothetical protein
MLKVYVVASFQSAPSVRAIHDRLRMLGIEPTSSWAEEAHGAEALDGLSDEECYAIWARNRDDLDNASVALVLADTPMREGFAEASYALRSGVDTVWVGRPTLQARAHGGVWFVESVDAAIEGLAGMVRP